MRRRRPLGTLHARGASRAAGALLLTLQVAVCHLALAPPAAVGETENAPQSISGVQIKGKAPVNPTTLAPRLPRPKEATLANGLQIVLIEDHKLPTFTIRLVIDRGSIADPPGKSGLAQATAALLRHGTRTRDAAEIAEALDSLGASFGARVDLGSTFVTVSGLSEHLDATLEVFADVLRNPTFPASELELYKQRFVAQIQQLHGSSSFLAQKHFARAVYGDFPAAQIVPAEEDIRSLRSADLQAFHAASYAPNIAMLLVAGDITMAALKPKLERTLGGWPRKQIEPTRFPPVKGPAEARVYVIDRPGAVQTSLVMGNLAVRGDDPDRFALGVMNRILGGSPAARLFSNLREDKGYTYGAYSSVSSYRYPGVASAYADVRTEVTAEAMREFMAELARIAEQPVSDLELANAKRALIGSFALSLENPQSFLDYVYRQKLYGFSDDYWDKYPQYINAVAHEDVARVAAEYFDPGKMQIIAVGEAARIREAMSKYGKVEVGSDGE